MADLYTKDGRPLRRGRYAGIIVGERVVYRSTRSARIASASVSANRGGSGSGNSGASGM